MNNNSITPIYYNLSLINGYKNSDEIFLSPSIIEEYNNQVILKNQKEYYVSVARANIPTSSIPMIIVPIETNLGFDASNNPIPQPNKDLTIYKIRFRYQTEFGAFTIPFDLEKTVIFQSQFKNLTVNPPSLNNNKQDFSNSYYYVYDIEQMILMFNDTLKSAFLEFCSQPDIPTFNPDFFPYITFDYSTRIFSINMTANYYNGATTINYFDEKVFPNISLQFDAQSSDLFQFTGYSIGDGFIYNNCFNKYDNITLIQDGSTAQTIFKMTASQSSLNMWRSISKIVFIINYGISTIQEYDSVPIASNENTQINNSSKPQVPILTDLETDLYNWSINRNYITFDSNSITQARLISMTGAMLQSFKLSVKWVDVFGNYQDINLPQGQPLSIKLAFYPKTTTLI